MSDKIQINITAEEVSEVMKKRFIHVLNEMSLEHWVRARLESSIMECIEQTGHKQFIAGLVAARLEDSEYMKSIVDKKVGEAVSNVFDRKVSAHISKMVRDQIDAVKGKA